MQYNETKNRRYDILLKYKTEEERWEMKELREKINNMLDKFTSEEMLRKAYEYISFIYIRFCDKSQK